MNCKQANEIPINHIVESFTGSGSGIQKTFTIWYKSPFRDEKTPSFRVDLRTNRWKDFGKPGKNEGSVIDFILELKNCDIETALSLIEDLSRGTRIEIKNSFFSFQEQSSFQNYNPESGFIDKSGENELSNVLEVISVNPLKNRSLLHYLESRKIDPDVAGEYLEEIYFRNNKVNKNYFALGFRNDSGAYEYRNKYLGGVIGHKDISTIGVIGSKIALFEGFFDFLSYLSMRDRKIATEGYIVLNSVNLVERAVEKIENSDVNTILSFLDNDNAGDLTTDFLKSRLMDKLSDQRSIYAGFKDYNDYLQQNV